MLFGNFRQIEILMKNNVLEATEGNKYCNKCVFELDITTRSDRYTFRTDYKFLRTTFFRLLSKS